MMTEIFKTIITAVIGGLFTAGLKWFRVKRKRRLDQIGSNERLQAFSDIALLQKRPRTDLNRLALIAAYEKVGLYYPLAVCQALLSFISRKGLAFSDPRLTGFLNSERVMTVKGQTLSLSQGKFMMHLLITVLCFALMVGVTGLGVDSTWAAITLPTGSQTLQWVAFGFLSGFVVVGTVGGYLFLKNIRELYHTQTFWAEFSPYL